jgi:hypothetical protein
VHAVCAFNCHLLAYGKVEQSEAIVICTLMQAVLSLSDVWFPGQHLRLRLPSPTSRHDLGRLRMPAPAVHKIDPWPLLLIGTNKLHETNKMNKTTETTEPN